MSDDDLQDRLDDWIEGALRAFPPPDSVAAFCFNLYEAPFAADLIGTPAFDPADSDWATDEIWEASPRILPLPQEAWGTGWEDALETVLRLVTNYLRGDSIGAKRLRSARGVAVGFHDGDLHVLSGPTA